MAKILEEWAIGNGLYECPYCGVGYVKQGLGYHIWKKHGAGKKFIPFKAVNKIGRPAWNKNLTKETHSSLMKISNTLKEKYDSGEILKPKHTNESKAKLSKIAIKNGFGGTTQSRWISYKEKKLGSTYELIVAKSLDQNNIKWDTCKKIPYTDPYGKIRTYTPDFYLEEYNIYLDPKNDFLINNINPRLGFTDQEKIGLVEQQHNIKILILNKYQLEWNEIKKLL